MPGSFAYGFHEGSRSEILADYLFSSWGVITPVRRQDDYGVDLYGGLAEHGGLRSIITDYYVVQVKSNTEPWVFPDEEAVKWLIYYPVPIFLACVNKKETTLAVYHVTPRFYVALLGNIPPRLDLRPDTCDAGRFVDWEGGESYTLSAPILRIALDDLINDERLAGLRKVFAYWVKVDRDNIDLLRFGLLRLRMPLSYKVNEIPTSGMAELGNAVPNDDCLARGIRTLLESVECIGGQLGRRGDRKGALIAALLADHIRSRHSTHLDKSPLLTDRLPGDLGMIVANGLNRQVEKPDDRYTGLDRVQKHLENHPLVREFLK